MDGLAAHAAVDVGGVQERARGRSERSFYCRRHVRRRAKCDRTVEIREDEEVGESVEVEVENVKVAAADEKYR